MESSIWKLTSLYLVIQKIPETFALGTTENILNSLSLFPNFCPSSNRPLRSLTRFCWLPKPLKPFLTSFSILTGRSALSDSMISTLLYIYTIMTMSALSMGFVICFSDRHNSPSWPETGFFTASTRIYDRLNQFGSSTELLSSSSPSSWRALWKPWFIIRWRRSSGLLTWKLILFLTSPSKLVDGITTQWSLPAGKGLPSTFYLHANNTTAQLIHQLLSFMILLSVMFEDFILEDVQEHCILFHALDP